MAVANALKMIQKTKFAASICVLPTPVAKNST